MLGVSSNAPVKTTQRSNVDPSGKKYSALSIPIVTAGEIHTISFQVRFLSYSQRLNFTQA